MRSVVNYGTSRQGDSTPETVTPQPDPPWELRVGQLRVFYEVAGAECGVVRILLLGRQPELRPVHQHHPGEGGLAVPVGVAEATLPPG